MATQICWNALLRNRNFPSAGTQNNAGHLALLFQKALPELMLHKSLSSVQNIALPRTDSISDHPNTLNGNQAESLIIWPVQAVNLGSHTNKLYSKLSGEFPVPVTIKLMNYALLFMRTPGTFTKLVDAADKIRWAFRWFAMSDEMQRQGSKYLASLKTFSQKRPIIKEVQSCWLSIAVCPTKILLCEFFCETFLRLV